MLINKKRCLLQGVGNHKKTPHFQVMLPPKTTELRLISELQVESTPSRRSVVF